MEEVFHVQMKLAHCRALENIRIHSNSTMDLFGFPLSFSVPAMFSNLFYTREQSSNQSSWHYHIKRSPPTH